VLEIRDPGSGAFWTPRSPVAQELKLADFLCLKKPVLEIRDPGSGAFLTLDPGSGMGKKSRSGSEMNIPDHISESVKTIPILKFDADGDADPGSGNLFDPGSGIEKIRVRYPG
jgi:hypothetical protein